MLRCLILLCCAALLQASPLDEAYQAYQAGDLSTAAARYKALAEAGQPLAQFNYAMMLKRAEANGGDWLPWLEKAAQGGVMNAAHALGLIYENGDGVKRTQTTATTWFRKAAELGHVEAQVSLATQLFLGRGVQQDYAESARWYEQAAEAGHAGAQYLIAAQYEHGDGVARDLEKALHWYIAAARQGDPVAKQKAKDLAKVVSSRP